MTLIITIPCNFGKYHSSSLRPFEWFYNYLAGLISWLRKWVVIAFRKSG